VILLVEGPDGERQVPLDTFPFEIGRQPENHLVLPDARVSRHHARLLADNGRVFVEDRNSRLGISVNGQAAKRAAVAQGDLIELGPYRLRIAVRRADAFSRLREILEVARAMDGTLATPKLLDAIVDAAVKVTESDRGFLFLRRDGGVEMAAARDAQGAPLDETCLRVPRKLIEEGLSRREAFAINFDADREIDPGQTVVLLELRSSVFVPLPRAGGLLYLDSRSAGADLAAGNRELLETLALEASAVLESARGFEESERRRKLEDELALAREVQRNLQPREYPREGWLRAWGATIPSRQIAGDSFDIRALPGDRWAFGIVDVSGKGAGAALLAALLQGALFMATGSLAETVARLNRFLLDRQQGEQYATLFVATLHKDGTLRYVNAGHPPPIHAGGQPLAATGMPLGLIDSAAWEMGTVQLAPGDRVILYSDGLSDAVPVAKLTTDDEGLHATLAALTEPEDDVTVLVVDYDPA